MILDLDLDLALALAFLRRIKSKRAQFLVPQWRTHHIKSHGLRA